MKLDNNALYKLTKIGTKNSDSKYFSEGDTHIGQASLKKYLDGGEHLLIGGVITSRITKTTDQENGNYLVETKNSIYTLEKVNNGEEK
jgi:hypothetical protein